MENKTNLPDVPYMVHEDDMARLERTIKRLWILCLVLIIALLGTNAGWLYYEHQFIDTEIMQEIDTSEGDATVIGVGDYYGESKADYQDKN